MDDSARLEGVMKKFDAELASGGTSGGVLGQVLSEEGMYSL